MATANTKLQPTLFDDATFDDVPRVLRNTIGTLLGTEGEQIVLGNSASYGLHLIANGLQWKAADEVLLLKGDFPATTLPWLLLRKRGVNVRFIQMSGMLDPDNLRKQLSPATKVVCLSWVDSYVGTKQDIQRLGEMCRANGVMLVLNGSQAIGSMNVSVKDMPIDAITCCGYKWLCGPYGTGFCWMSRSLLENLNCNQVNWWPWRDKIVDAGLEILDTPGDAQRFDVFCTANHFNFIPWTESIQHLLKCGLNEIESHNQTLVERFIGGLDKTSYELLSPSDLAHRSCIIVLSHRDPSLNPRVLKELEQQGLHIAKRRGKLRLSPHLYNSLDDVDLALDVLNYVANC